MLNPSPADSCDSPADDLWRFASLCAGGIAVECAALQLCRQLHPRPCQYSSEVSPARLTLFEGAVSASAEAQSMSLRDKSPSDTECSASG